jgi:O-antigen ligase
MVETTSRSARVGFFLFAAHLFSIFSIAASNSLLGLCLLAAPWTVVRKPLSPPARRWLMWLGLYILFLGISALLAYDPGRSLWSLWSFFNFTSPVLALYVLRREQDARRVVKLVILLAALLAAAGLVQYQLGSDDLSHRIRGSLSHYMTFAGVLLIGDCLLLGWIFCGQGKRKLWAWVALVLIQLALLGSFTRNAWVAILVAVTALIVVRAPKLLLAYVPAAALLLLLAPAPVTQRILSIGDLKDPSAYDRLCMASAGLEMIADRPFFGLGPEMVSRRYTIYRHPTAPRYWVPHLHNSYLDVAAESGLVSLAAFLTLFALSAKQAWERWRGEGGSKGPRADLWAGVLLALLAFAVAGLFENNWADTEVQRVALFVMVLPFCLPPGAEDAEAAESP